MFNAHWFYFNHQKRDNQWQKRKRYVCLYPINMGKISKHEEYLLLIGGAKAA